MRILYHKKNLSREEWLQCRRVGIGGSDVSIIAGLNKYKSIYELWEEKTGEVSLKETASEVAYWGTVLENVVKQEFMKRTGLKVRAKNMILQHEKYPFMIADLDGVVRDNTGELCVFEAKTAIEYKKEAWEEGIPEEYQLQVQHYLAVTGYKKAYIAALVGGNKFYLKEIERDEEMIELIISMEEKFWNCVVEKKMPEPVGAERTGEWLDNYYKKVEKSKILLPEESKGWIDHYLEVNEELKRLNEEKKELANRLKLLLQNKTEGVVGMYQVRWNPTVTERLNSKKLKAEQPDIYEQYVEKIEGRRFSIAG